MRFHFTFAVLLKEENVLIKEADHRLPIEGRGAAERDRRPRSFMDQPLPPRFPPLKRRLFSLGAELRGAPLIPSVVSGLIVAMCTAVVGVSTAALVFGGELSPWVPLGITLFLFGSVVFGAGAALFSSFPSNITIPEDRLAPIIGLLAAAIVTRLHGVVPTEEIAQTVLAAIAVATLLTGLTYYLLGRFRLGNLIRFIPYPVLGGFLAGSGWLLFSGSFRVMTGIALQPSTLLLLSRPENAVLWLPGLGFGVLMLAVLRWRPHVLAVPALLAGAIGLFYLVSGMLHLPLDRMRQSGWLLQSLSSVPVTQIHGIFAWHGIHWGAIAAESSFIAALLLTAVISLLLTDTALETSINREIDLNDELRTTGLLNLAGGLGGSFPGFAALSLTRLPISLGAGNRLTGLIYAGICGLVLLCGNAFLSYIPKFVLGGLLLFAGLEVLVEWVVDARRRLPRIDYLILLLILFVVGAVGYLQGIGVGIVAASALFIVGYSRIGVVSRRFTGAERHSNVERAEAEARLLRENGESLLLLKLQGFIFFGSANKLYEAVRDRAFQPGAVPLRFVVLDFGRVTGLDSSSIVSLVKIRELGESQGFRLVFVLVSPTIRAQFEIGGLFSTPAARLFPDCDQGLEWCEDEMLRLSPAADGGEASLVPYLAKHWPEGSDPTRLDHYLERISIAADEILFRQGDPSSELYFLESGRVRVDLELENERVVRLRSLLKGTVVGELGFYLRVPRNATVRAETPCRLRRLTGAGLQRMEEEEPAVALLFHHYMSRLLADRLSATDRSLQAALE